MVSDRMTEPPTHDAASETISPANHRFARAKMYLQEPNIFGIPIVKSSAIMVLGENKMFKYKYKTVITASFYNCVAVLLLFRLQPFYTWNLVMWGLVTAASQS